MTADLLICWYALGVIACGLKFAFRVGVSHLLCVLFPWAIILAACFVLLGEAIDRLPRIDPSKQYLWRKP